MSINENPALNLAGGVPLPGAWGIDLLCPTGERLWFAGRLSLSLDGPHDERAGVPAVRTAPTPLVIMEAAPRAESALPPRSLVPARTGAASRVQIVTASMFNRASAATCPGSSYAERRAPAREGAAALSASL